MTQNDWQARLTRTIAGEIRRSRQARRMSAQQLADKCTDLGMPIHRSVIANLESGRRPLISAAELLVLAKALAVPALLLLVPLGHAETVEILPDQNVDAWIAYKWVAGEPAVPLPPVPILEPSATALELFRMHDHYERAVRAAQLSGDSGKIQEAVGVVQAVRRFMRDRGLLVPVLSEEVPALARLAEQEQEASQGT